VSLTTVPAWGGRFLFRYVNQKDEAMNQQHLNRAVAQATGESLATIAQMGFVPLTRVPYERDPEDYSVDWDGLDEDRRVSVFARRRPRPAVV
jgi:hypothetical protein